MEYISRSLVVKTDFGQQIRNKHVFFPRLLCNNASFQSRESSAHSKFYCFVQLLQSEANSGMPLLCLYGLKFTLGLFFCIS